MPQGTLYYKLRPYNITEKPSQSDEPSMTKHWAHKQLLIKIQDKRMYFLGNFILKNKSQTVTLLAANR